MESSSRFRFRDHPEMENSTDSPSSSTISSESSDRDNELEIESMTGKGIKHLCSELLELQAASDEEFHRNIFSNYSALVRIFEEVKGMKDEIMQLKVQLSTQKRLVKELMDGMYLKLLSTETIDSIIEETECVEPSAASELESHINDVFETLDILLSENRIDQAIDILSMGVENLLITNLEDYPSSDILMLYKSAISERKATLILQLTLVAENPRTSALELQKALLGVCRLGDDSLATRLLLKNYHSRIAIGIQNLQCSKSYLHGSYIKKLSKFIFSMISEAARSFMILCGETSPYASQLAQWAHEETQVFVLYFNKYVKSVSEISGGLSTVVEGVQFALSYCSLLEAQRLVLLPFLIEHILPCMDEVLQIHIDHFKKVIGIFTTNDAWVLGRYLVSGVLNEGRSLVVVGQHSEYCLLTNSGRKFLTLLQAITDNVTSLVALQMEGSIITGVMDLFMEYVFILEKAITGKTNVEEKDGSRINLAGSLQQQVSVLANLSTVEQLFSVIVQGIVRGTSPDHADLMKNESVVSQQKELDSCMRFVKEAATQLRACFFQQFISRMMSLESDSGLILEICPHTLQDPDIFHAAMPSVNFQVLFLELRKLDKLAEDNIFEMDWLMELLRELIEGIFVWISNNIGNSYISNQEQFVLDVYFLMGIASCGGYFSKHPLVLPSLMRSAFISAGLDSERYVGDDGWAKAAANEAIQRLLETKKANPLSNQLVSNFKEEPHEKQSENKSNSFLDEDRNSSENFVPSEEDKMARDPSGVAINTNTVILNEEVSPCEGSLELCEKDYSVESISVYLTNNTGGFGDLKSENTANAEHLELQVMENSHLAGQNLTEGIDREVSKGKIPPGESASREPDVSKIVMKKLNIDAETEFLQTEIASSKDPT